MHAHDEGFGRGADAWQHAAQWRMNFGQRGWIRPTVLKVLESGPKNGIEIMDSIREMSRGWWRPSPGSIYPLLEQLSGEGVIKKNSSGKYELTKTYRKESVPVNDTDDIITKMESSASYFEELAHSDRKAFSEYKDRIRKVAKRLSELA